MFFSSKIKKYICIFCVIICVYSLAGCGTLSKSGTQKSDDGRSFGGKIEEKYGDTAHTAFFDLTVEDVKTYETCQYKDGLYQAKEGMQYLIVTVTVKNTYVNDLKMSITDFAMQCDEDEKNLIYGYGKSELTQEGMMENLYTLKTGESITKSIMYSVPISERYTLRYTEFYSDEFEGNSYYMDLAE